MAYVATHYIDNDPSVPFDATNANKLEDEVERISEVLESGFDDTNIADNAINTNKILNEAVTAAKINSTDWASKANIGDYSKVQASQSSAYIVAVSATKTLELSDAGTFQRCTNSTSINIIIPLNSSVEFPIGTEIEIYRGGEGAVIITPTETITIECVSATYSITSRYLSACLKKIDTNTWVIQGAV